MKRNIIITAIGLLAAWVISNCGEPLRYDNIPKEREEQPGEGVPQDFSHTGPDVVFIGNSITRLFREYTEDGQNWFAKNNYVGKGIDGQTSTSIKNRFDADVLALDPWCVVISAGTNDIARNGGNVPLSTIMSNIETMAQKAKAQHIKVFLASVTPACNFWWSTDPELTADYIRKFIKDLNAAIKDYAEVNNFTYVDYYSATKGSDDCAPGQYFYDGVHPSAAGFAVMAGVVKPLLDEALGK
ncbi:MAG: GDSL-type esterase/lipase family protein [Prevotellaceae bacterium]|jgi:lysophospholipase L1-like esterase|nr:GDSL-type esterase/lipase family protein [Prevotellaceae bacterium]